MPRSACTERTKDLQLFQGHLLLANILQHEVARGLDAARVVLHVKGDGAARLGASTNVIKLEAHESLHKSCVHDESLSRVAAAQGASATNNDVSSPRQLWERKGADASLTVPLRIQMLFCERMKGPQAQSCQV